MTSPSRPPRSTTPNKEKADSVRRPIFTPDKKEKRSVGRPAHIYTKDQRDQVEALAGFGMQISEIALIVGIEERSISNHFKNELKSGLAKADAAVMKSLFRMATGDGHNAASSAIFWAKVRRRWHEVQRIVHGFDPEVLQQFIGILSRVIKKVVPDTCPHCKTNLNLKPELAKELRDISEKVTAATQKPEYVALHGAAAQPEK